MFKCILKIFGTPKWRVKPKKNVFVTFRNGVMHLDVNRFLSSPEGKRSLQESRELTDRLIAEGKIIDLTKKHNSA